MDVAVRRWERYTGKTAVLEATGQTFEDVEAARMAANDSAWRPRRSHECCAPGTAAEVTGTNPLAQRRCRLQHCSRSGAHQTDAGVAGYR